MKSPASTPRSALAKASMVLLLVAFSVTVLNCTQLFPRHGWNKGWGPLVPHKNFPGDCGICHVPSRWDLMVENFDFDHFAETGFALEESHAYANCLRCHNDRGPVGVYVARGCAGCHVDPHRDTLGMECTQCHNQTNWMPTGLVSDHARTRFPLVASHALTPCESCHPNATQGEFRGAPAECHFCHQREASLAFPNHIVSGWVVGCESCHDMNQWSPSRFNHDFFPLQGGHAGLLCTQCHVGGFAAALDPNCFACHQNDYLAAPNHVALNYSTDCTQCHNINAWR